MNRHRSIQPLQITLFHESTKALCNFFKEDKNTKENGVKDLCTLYAIFDKLKYEIFSSKRIYHFNARFFFLYKGSFLYLWIVLVRMIECI